MAVSRARAADIQRAARWRRLVAAGALATGVGLLLGAGPAASQDGGTDPQVQQQPRVLVTSIEGTIGPVIADHIGDVVSRAENDGYDALVVEIDTPGGLDTSMRDIIQSFFASDVPIIAYVSPDGARAASAGSFITLAAHVAAMSPGTAIGAATPVQLGGDQPTDAERKAIEDAAAYAESIAEARDRDVEFAIETVTESRSVSATEAVEIGAVDLAANSLPELLDEVDGWTVEVAGDRPVTLATAGAELDRADMGFFRQIQQFLADPNLAFLFMSIGTLGLIYELANPGFGVAGVVGAVLIILAMFGLAVLPVNVVGIMLFVIAILLFIAELFAPGIGVAAAGGTAALLLSGVFLFRGTPGLEVGFGVLIPIAVVVGGFVIVAGRLVMRTRKRSTTTGEGLFIGRTVTVEQITDERRQTGMAFVEGAWWTVRSAGPPLEVGDTTVVDVDGLTLIVEPTAEEAERESAADDSQPSRRGTPEQSGTDDATERTVTSERTGSAGPVDRSEPTDQAVSNGKPHDKRIGTS